MSRVRERDPPVFHGEPHEDVAEWVARYQQVADYNSWNPAQAQRHLGMFLDGVARKWFISLQQPPPNFEALENELMRAFKHHNYELELDSQLRARTQGETEPAMSYCYDVIFLCSKIDTDMLETVKVHILRGLLP